MRRASTLMSQFASNMKGQLNEGLIDPAKKAKVEYKDVARIVQGILISKVFYGSLNAIRAATDSVWEFSKQLEYAKIAYSNLFGDQALALEFINVLKDFAAETPFTFQESEAAAKRLLAYGVQYKNVMYMMKGVLAASSMQGNPQVIEQISRALGQIYTKGRLMNEEMRQLAEAGIPAYQILKEKLGLTTKQLQNLGREAIPASKAINALVDGMTERFGNVIDASVLTPQGIISNLKDNATMLFAALFDPLTQRIKSVLFDIGQFFAKMRKLQELKGNGGVFEAIVPEKAQEAVRTLLANLITLWRAFKQNIGIVLEMGKVLLAALIPALNVVIPIVVSILTVFGHLQKAFLSNSTAVRVLVGALAACAFAWALFRTQAILTTVVAKLIGIINGISKAVLFLSAALVRSPIVTMLILITAAILGISIASQRAGNAISGLMNKLTGLNGVKSSNVLQPVNTKQASDLSKFNEKLDDTADAMDKVNDKSKKATKSLLSFDEVYQLGSGADGGDTSADEAEEVDLSGFNIPGDALIPEIPSFEDFSTDFVKSLQDTIGDKLKSAGIGMSIGAILGAIFGGLIGGPAGAVLGAKIGAVAGAIAGWFWKDIVKYFKTPEGTQVAIGMGIGAVIGGIIGGPVGALVGAAVGGLATWVANKFWPKVHEVLTQDKNAGFAFGDAIGKSIGMVMGGPIGASISNLIGGLVGFLGSQVEEHWPSILAKFTEGWDKACATIGEARLKAADKFAEWLTDVGKWSENVRQSIVSGFINAKDNAAAELEAMKSRASEKLEELLQVVSDKLSGIPAKVQENFSLARQNMSGSLTQMKTDAVNGLKGIYDAFTNWMKDLWSNVFDKLFGWLKDAFDGLADLDVKSSAKTVTSTVTTVKTGTGANKKAATGGIITKEDVVRVGEGNKKESIIPLDNLEAMKPFSDAVSAGIAQVLLPVIANMNANQEGNTGSLVVNAGVLVADDASLKVLERKLARARAQEDTRR